MTPDVNVLVAASRADHPHHDAAYTWLTEASAATARGARLMLLPMVAAGFIRVVTQRRIFSVPTPTTQAVAFVHVLLAQYGVALGELGAEWPVLVGLCEEHAWSGTM